MKATQLFSAVVFSLVGTVFQAKGAVFTDDFTSGASPQWSNLRGSWSGAGGVYSATAPTNNPLDYTSLPFVLGDLSFDIDINQIGDGGIWLHSDAAGQNGVLLITGGNGYGAGNRGGTAGSSLYFQIMQNGVMGPITSEITHVFSNPGVQNTHVQVSIVGNVYTATAEGKSTSITTSLFPTGRVGLYDFSSQTFDNVVLAPEPASISLLAVGAILMLRRRKNVS